MADSFAPSSKKRAAGREISRDNPGFDDDEESLDLESRTFKKASDEVIAARRIVKVRRKPTTSTPSSNPFAGICLVPTPAPPAPTPEVTNEPQAEGKCAGKVTEKEVTNEPQTEGKCAGKVTEKEVTNEPQTEVKCAGKVTEKEIGANGELDVPKGNEKEKEKNANQSENKSDAQAAEASVVEESACDKNEETDSTPSKAEIIDDKQAVDGDKTGNGDTGAANENKDMNGDATTPFSSFGQLSSNQNAFTGFTGTGFSFGSVTKDSSALGTSSGSPFGLQTDQPSFPSFSFGLPNNGSSSVFGSVTTSTVTKSETSKVPPMQEVPTETGEENEKAVFTADAILFEFLDGGWKERGKGELKVNVSTTATEKGRIIMRARGKYRLIMNASIYQGMKLTNMEKKGITFACVNSAGEGNAGLSTFALKFKDGSIVEEFRTAVSAYQNKKPTPTPTGLKTPENSP